MINYVYFAFNKCYSKIFVLIFRSLIYWIFDLWKHSFCEQLYVLYTLSL